MRPSLRLIAFSGLLLLPALAKADTFTFSAIGSGGGFSGSGQLTAGNNGDGSYTITGITGTGVTGLSNFYGADNLLFPNATRLLDINGFSFTDTLAGGTLDVNLFSTVAGYEAITLDSEGDFTDTPVTFTLAGTSPVPEPSSLILLGSGALAMAGAVRRRLAR